jgi:hypothetical protein
MIREAVSIVIVMCVATPALAQIESGDWRLSAGFAGFTYSNVDIDGFDTKASSLGISPGGSVRIGYAPVQLVEFGLDLELAYSRVKFEGSEATDATYIALGPYVALNFAITDNAYLSPSVSLGYSHLENERVGDVEADYFRLLAGAEVKIFVADDASIDLGLFFRYEEGKGEAFGFDFDEKVFAVGPRVTISIWP